MHINTLSLLFIIIFYDHDDDDDYLDFTRKLNGFADRKKNCVFWNSAWLSKILLPPSNSTENFHKMHARPILAWSLPIREPFKKKIKFI